ncbi:lactonase family protein [soil metagenome]
MFTLSRRGFLATAAVLPFAPTIQAADAAKYWVYIGTGGGGKPPSKGIYRCEFDPITGKLGEPELAAEVSNPGFLAIHPTKKFLYSLGKVDKADGVVAYSLDAKTGAITKLNEFKLGGVGPCHLNVDKTGRCLVVANYGGGSCTALKVDKDGKLGTDQDFHQHKGSSVNPARQKEPHTHSANFTPDGQYVILADLGLDKLIVYKVDAAAGTLTEHGQYKMNLGSGPRHFAWHPNGKWAYSNGELDASVTALSYDAEKGTFATINANSTLPADTAESVRKGNSTAETVVHPSGKWVFVSNRGHNSLAVFKVGAEGGLTPAGHVTGDIKVPRNFNIDPSGKWILVANQDGDSVTVFEWDNDKGTAKANGGKIAVPRPICLKFVAKE